MNIGFDLDGVLYPWQEVIHKYCLDHQITADKDEKIFWTKWVREHEDIMSELVLITDFYTREPPYVGAVDMINRLAKQHTIYYITSRADNPTYYVLQGTYNWLTRYGFPFTNNLIFTKNKPEMVKHFNIDVYVEDRVELAYSLHELTDVYLVNKPYNLAWEEPNDIIRINSVTELERFIK